MQSASVAQYLDSPDPLSESAFLFLLGYREEDSHIDFKLDFDPGCDKAWLEIAKDIYAFANTGGGYILFGVKNGTYENVGLGQSTYDTLTDTNNIIKKINRHVEPPLTSLRAKGFSRDKKRYVVLSIPKTPSATHVVSKDATYRSGNVEKTVLRRGQIYVRRSAGNELVTSRDVDRIVEERMQRFRNSLLENIAHVVRGPAESKVVVFSDDPNSEPHERFLLDDSPAATLVKGLAFTVPPSTMEQEITAWVSILTRTNLTKVPPDERIWEWYAAREQLRISEKYRIHLARFAILMDAPIFYWLNNCKKQSIGEMLDKVAEVYPRNGRVEVLLGVASYVGKQTHRKILSRLKQKGRRIDPEYLVNEPRTICKCFKIHLIEVRQRKAGRNDRDFRTDIKNELDTIAASARSANGGRPNAVKRYMAQAMDCYLYGLLEEPVSGQNRNRNGSADD